MNEKPISRQSSDEYIENVDNFIVHNPNVCQVIVGSANGSGNSQQSPQRITIFHENGIQIIQLF